MYPSTTSSHHTRILVCTQCQGHTCHTSPQWLDHWANGQGDNVTVILVTRFPVSQSDNIKAPVTVNSYSRLWYVSGYHYVNPCLLLKEWKGLLQLSVLQTLAAADIWSNLLLWPVPLAQTWSLLLPVPHCFRSLCLSLPLMVFNTFLCVKERLIINDTSKLLSKY